MDLFGDKLREIRTEKKLSIDQVARETRISRKYLEAIEDNDFTIFPSETYLIGFLRSYTEYLGLDSTKYITQYKNYKIQEQPIPINELLDNKKKIHPALLVLLIVLGVGIVAAASIFGYSYFINRPAADNAAKQTLPETDKNTGTGIKKYYFKDEINSEWFSQNDEIIFPLGDKEYTLRVTSITGDNSVKLMVDDKTEVQVNKEDQATLNFNADDNVDMRIVLNTIEEKEGRVQVYLGLYKVTAAVADNITNITGQPSPTITAGSQGDAPAKTETAAPIAAENSTNANVIYETQNAEPFVLKMVFKGDCLFRYLLDNRDRYQRFFLKDDNIDDINVNRSIKLWLSNAGSVKASIAGKEIILGKAGQVVTKQIQWKRNEETKKYRLEISSIY